MRPAGGEALWGRGVGGREDGGACRHALLGETVVHVVGRQQAEAGVPVLREAIDPPRSFAGSAT